MDSNDLESLVIAAQTGDLSAYGQIVAQFQGMACGYAYSLLGDFHLAEDAAQDAFVEAYHGLGNLQVPLAFPGWFRQIVHHRTVRLTRGKHLPLVPLDEAAHVATSGPTPGRAAEDREIRDRVLQAIASLAEPERMVTALFYINGYSQAEIAGFLDIPTGTVKSRLHASRRQLKERMLTMVGKTLHENAPQQRFCADVIDRLVGGPNLLAIAGHPVKQALDAVVAALPEFQVIRPSEFLTPERLPETLVKDVAVAQMDSFRHPQKGLLRHWAPWSTLQAAFGQTPPVRLLNPERLFMPRGWPQDSTIQVAHVIDLICIGEDVNEAWATQVLTRAIQAVHPNVKVRVNWGPDDDSIQREGGYPRVVRRGVDVLVPNGSDWFSVARGGLLNSQILREMGYDPGVVSCAHIGIGGERIVLPRLGLRLEDVGRLWQSPHLR